jgi:hypothetical protein
MFVFYTPLKKYMQDKTFTIYCKWTSFKIVSEYDIILIKKSVGIYSLKNTGRLCIKF